MYFTGSAGGDYDVAPYDAAPAELSSFGTVTGLAVSLNLEPRIHDVLDLGCGFGRQLAHAAEFAPGRLVGVDASRATCDGARAILEPWSDRAEIIQTDIATLDAHALGSFDLIYCIGTLYTVPSPTREVLLETIRQCLRPGGLVLFSYYAGTNGLIKVAVGNYLRSLQQPGMMMSDALDAARRHLTVAGQFQTPSPVAVVQDQIARVARSDNIVLAHEVLGHGIEVQNTARLAAELSPAGINFLGYLGYDPANFAGEVNARLFLAETLDLLEGGYRYALFAQAVG